jgi:hypothetical protein
MFYPHSRAGDQASGQVTLLRIGEGAALTVHLE